VTKRGFVGFAPPGSRVGDVVCLFLGCQTPSIIRRYRKHSVAGQGKRKPRGGAAKLYQLVGECYLHGMMDGEMVQTDAEKEVFRLT
jgi:hypothetical protein